jgi:hypothetical protein
MYEGRYNKHVNVKKPSPISGLRTQPFRNDEAASFSRIQVTYIHFYLLIQGCQIFLGRNIPERKNYTTCIQNIPNGRKICRYTEWTKNGLNGHKIFQHLQFEDSPKFTQSGIFGLKITIWQPCQDQFRSQSAPTYIDVARAAV